ncbi:hypothetical protein L1987_42300 [Smallanthus sonchifolius]|uniref:Uncharacterized protein n=1 Tax=Smallanthus sonchifolius TaxID=185202 RepID=A0ACB9GXI1_9ASTR|nr:hypothetical protein L1987_42300 [Smallanthus sonchifolius]
MGLQGVRDLGMLRPSLILPIGLFGWPFNEWILALVRLAYRDVKMDNLNLTHQNCGIYFDYGRNLAWDNYCKHTYATTKKRDERFQTIMGWDGQRLLLWLEYLDSYLDVDNIGFRRFVSYGLGKDWLFIMVDIFFNGPPHKARGKDEIVNLFTCLWIARLTGPHNAWIIKVLRRQGTVDKEYEKTTTGGFRHKEITRTQPVDHNDIKDYSMIVHMANGRSGIEVHQRELDRKTNLWTGKKRVKQRSKSNAWFYPCNVGISLCVWSFIRRKLVLVVEDSLGCRKFASSLNGPYYWACWFEWIWSANLDLLGCLLVGWSVSGLIIDAVFPENPASSQPHGIVHQSQPYSVRSKECPNSGSYAEKCKGLGHSPDPVSVVKAPVAVPDEDGFTLVNRKGKKNSIKMQRKKKQLVVSAKSIGPKPHQKAPNMGGVSSKQVVGSSAYNSGSGFDFARAVQGANSKPLKPSNHVPKVSPKAPGSSSSAPDRISSYAGVSMEVGPPQVGSGNRFAALNVISELDPFDQSIGTGTNFTELDIQASIKRTSLVEACSDLYPHEPMNEDVTSSAQSQSVEKEQAADKCVPETEKGRSYGISEAQRKAIADRLLVSSSICGEETVNWCPGEWDYFNDLCISLGLDPDYCIEDVDSDTENGTAQFFSDLWKSGCPKSNRVESEVVVHAAVGIDGEVNPSEGNETSITSDVQVATDRVGTPMQPNDRVIGVSVEEPKEDSNGGEVHVHNLGMGNEGVGDTSFMEHVNKEKPFESKFFELPDLGDSEPVEEEMKDVGAETPCEGKDGNDPRLSPRLTRLIEEQGINRYRLRSGDETGKGTLRHHAAKAKLMKLDRGRRDKQSDSFDKENKPINITVRPEENNLSGHVVGEANNAGQSIEEANMQSNLHGDVPGSDDTTISPAYCNMDRDEMQLGGPSLAGMLTTDKVTMNMEYAGDSILNNISIQSSYDDVLIEGEEQEVSSDQSTKYRSFTDMTSDKGNQKLAQTIYPDKWEDIGGEEGCIEEWDVIMNRNKECLDNENYLGIEELRKRMQTSWNRETDELVTNFCYNNNLAIMGPKKWIGSHTSLCRVEKRKTRDQQGQQQIRFDMGHGECDLNVCPFGRNKKATKSKKDAQGVQSLADNRERTNIKETLDEGGTRKHWRIWSSKNRKPEKNMPKSKHQFQLEFIPQKLTQDPILVNEFNFGTGKGKEIRVADKGKLRLFNNPGLRKIKEKEARLLEIAKSINATSENSKLINSIMGLTRSRITRFSARMNEAGHVMIDENMIENGMEGGDPTQLPLTLRQSSYANKVTG